MEFARDRLHDALARSTAPVHVLCAYMIGLHHLTLTLLEVQLMAVCESRIGRSSLATQISRRRRSIRATVYLDLFRKPLSWQRAFFMSSTRQRVKPKVLFYESERNENKGS